MTASIIDGKQIAADLRASTKELVSEFIDKYHNPPTLAVVLVGEDPALGALNDLLSSVLEG